MELIKEEQRVLDTLLIKFGESVKLTKKNFPGIDRYYRWTSTVILCEIFGLKNFQMRAILDRLQKKGLIECKKAGLYIHWSLKHIYGHEVCSENPDYFIKEKDVDTTIHVSPSPRFNIPKWREKQGIKRVISKLNKL